jgi:glycosyltransferase involved in cell wall biosynthesis
LPARISVIVPFLDAERTLRRCIEALLDQEGVDGSPELVFVDNNSSDSSARIVAAYPGVTLLREGKQGAYAARNRGLAHAGGGILAFTDPDCVPRRDWLARLVEPLERPEIRIVVGRARPDARSLALRMLGDYEDSRDSLVLASDDPALYYGRTNSMAVRRGVFETLGPFAERRRGADTLLVRAVADRWSYRAVCYRSEAEVLHLEVADVATWYRKVWTYGRSARRYGEVTPVRALTRLERWPVFRKACRDRAYPLTRRALLFLLLAAEGMTWKLGAWSARLAAARGAE